MFIPLHELYARTEITLYKTDTYSPLSAEWNEWLLDQLAPDDFTTAMVIVNHLGTPLYEMIKIINHCGALVLERSINGAGAIDIPCQSEIKFHFDTASIESIVCNKEECTEEQMSAKYKLINGFNAELTAPLATTDHALPLSDEANATLFSLLPAGYYTYLQIVEGYKVEVVKLTHLPHATTPLLFIARGQEGTSAKNFTHACVSSVLTQSGVENIICQMECCP